MPYSAEISRSNPTCFVLLIDQSASMDKPFGGDSGKKKADGVADAVNRLLQTLVYRCAKGDKILDRYHVGVIGYGKTVEPALGGSLSGRSTALISEIGNSPLRIEQRTKKEEDGAGGIVEKTVKFPIWFEAKADGQTPMCAALGRARDIVADFIKRCPGCYPPIVINISDGEATDGVPEPTAAILRSVASNDGEVLLFNAHISSMNEQPVRFPNRQEQLPDDYARLLFRMSSVLPPGMLKQAKLAEPKIGDNARGFVFNADLVSVVQFLDIGTRVDQNAR